MARKKKKYKRKSRKKYKYKPERPFTLFVEALQMYNDEVLKDDEARNNFLVHIQDLVEHCARRTATVSGKSVSEKIDDVIGFVNVNLLASWLPRYLSSKPKMDQIPSAIKYLKVSINGYIKKFIAKNFDPRIVPADRMEARARSFNKSEDDVEFGATYDRMFAEHVAMRPRPDLDLEVVEKLMRYLAWKECSENK
ncbi:MAG: hypothetical protein KAJ19_23135 [Gammaproteobacteria bacterium]|nr:hypothetical protein [Gammaproteobacteria bacterium]